MAHKDKAAEIKYKNDYTRQTYDVLRATPTKETGAAIRAAAAAAGESVSGYILKAVQDRMEKEKAGE